MEETFGTVLFVVVGVAIVVAIATFAGAGKLYEQIGRGGLSLRDGSELGGEVPQSGSAGDLRERDEEIRQMLTAANERRSRRGEEPLDVETELSRLTAPAVDAALREEVRQLVVARNNRRLRKGEQPLDVDAEVERQLRELA